MTDVAVLAGCIAVGVVLCAWFHDIEDRRYQARLARVFFAARRPLPMPIAWVVDQRAVLRVRSRR